MATRELIVLSIGLAAYLFYLGLERTRLDRALRRVPKRVAVTGTRGKSETTRLVAAGLRASGARVLAKTTGSRPALILPDGSEREIERPGGASIREQVRLVALAAEIGADTLVAEMMSIGPEYLAAESRRILRPGILAITNVRLDHLDDMGRTPDAVARTIARAVPARAAVFLPEEEVRPVFEEAAARTGSTLHPVGPGEEGDAREGDRRPRLGKFEPNLRLAGAILDALGVGEGTARRGMADAAADFGALRAWRGRFGTVGRQAVCVSAFAANDPASSAVTLGRIGRSIPFAGRPLVGLLSLREDRVDRTVQWVRAAGEGFFRDFAVCVLLGPTSRPALRRFRKVADGGARFFRFPGSDPGALMDRVFAAAKGEPVVVGLGNIVGWGERLVRYWSERGTVHDP